MENGERDILNADAPVSQSLCNLLHEPVASNTDDSSTRTRRLW